VFLLKKTLKKVYSSDGQDSFLPRLSLKVFNRPRTVAIVWLCLTIFGVASYTTLLQREGFPSVNIPFSVITGSYLVNDPAKVDSQVTKPIDLIALKDSHVKTVQSHAQGNFYDVIVQYKDGTNADAVGKSLSQRIAASANLPRQATVKVETPKVGWTMRGDDGVISLYAKHKGPTTEDLTAASNDVVKYIRAQHLPNLESISLIDPFIKGTDPVTGQAGSTQTIFDRYGARTDNHNAFYDSVSIGYQQKDGTDVLKLDNKLQAAVDRYNAEHQDSPYAIAISATYANDIRDQISELQRALLEGLIAVLIIGSIVIALRAALITIVSMTTVLAITVGLLLVIGSTLNTITMFALILCLGLIVDDTIIMVEALDAQRRKYKDPQQTVQIATRKVSRAMVAATTTAALSFAPFLFVGGVLGSFIREIPITIIASLAISLSVALFFIPLFARYLLLGKKQMGDGHVYEPAAAVEAKIAQFIGKPMLWAQHSRKKLTFVGLTAVAIGIGFILAGGFLFSKVTFNIFPPTKDSNNLSVQINFPPGTSIKQAEAIADRANAQFAQSIGPDFRSASYYSIANTSTASLFVYLTPYTERAPTSPQLADRANVALKNFKGADVKVTQPSNGPPSSAFSVQVQTDNRPAAQRLAKDLRGFLKNRELKRPSGKVAHITTVHISDPGTYYRAKGREYTEVTADFDGDDTSTLVTLAKDAVKKEFTPQKLRSYGLPANALQFDIGQEQENQDSFKTLALAFPVLLLAIYLLLALQFRSLAQPLLIFLAIPFSIFGITLGLFLTDNPFSFFAMLGFFALIGLSIKNTILLTDYANQLRRTGLSAVDSAVGALGERFRPLIATSFTAVVSLIPLSLSSPFWQGLTVVLIFGLLSSTFLVITVFPYYYLGVEFLRLRVSRKAGLSWLVLTIVLSVLLIKAGLSAAIIPLVALAVMVLEITFGRVRRRA
jgi:multidrug efflux pump subunit AcrB